MEKNTNELILEKLLKIESELVRQGEEQNRQSEILSRVEERTDTIEFNINKGFTETKDEIMVNREAITYIGNKVFDNHEHRIKTLEKQLT